MKTVRFIISMPETTKKSLDRTAKLKGKNTSEFLREIVVNYLLLSGAITPEDAAVATSMSPGGDQWSAKLNSDNPTERANAKKQLDKQAARARAAKTAKAAKIKISGNVQGRGSVISGSDCVVNVDNSQKKLPK